MKRICSIMTVLVFALNAMSQSYVPDAKDLKNFYRTKTLVVMEENPMLEYNLIIKEVISAEWHITPYDFITYKEFEETYRFKPEYSFLVMTNVAFERDNTGCEYRFSHVLLGGPYQTISDMPAIVSVPLAYKEVEEASYIYKLRTILRFMQNHVELINKNPDIISKNIFEYYNKNMKDIQKKTVYLVKEELASDINTIQKIKKVYPFKFKIATKEEIEQHIIDKDPDAVFLHKVGPEGTHLKARCYKIMMGAADANFYYFDYHMIDKDNNPDGLLMSDLKKMAKAKK